MADISNYLRIIKSAILGKDMRDAIHDALEATNANGAVTTNTLANGAVTTEKIKDNSVTTGKINNKAVTKEKLSDDLVSRIFTHIQGEKLTITSSTQPSVANSKRETIKVRDDRIDLFKTTFGDGTEGQYATSLVYVTANGKINAEKASLSIKDLSVGEDGSNTVLQDGLMQFGKGGATLKWDKDATDSNLGSSMVLSFGSTYFQIHESGAELNIISDDIELQYSNGDKAVKIHPEYLLLHSPSNEDSKIEITDEKVALSGNVILDNLEWIGITAGDAQFIHSKSLPHHILELHKDKADFKNSSNGFNAGYNSSATDGGVAIGNYASTTSGGAIGSEAESKNGFAGGYHAKATGMGAAVGANAHAYHGGAVGSGAQAGNGFAGGMDAKCGTAPNGADIDCIQLGTGTNGNEKTLQIYGYQLLDKEGHIPAERSEGTFENPKFINEDDLYYIWEQGWYIYRSHDKGADWDILVQVIQNYTKIDPDLAMEDEYSVSQIQYGAYGPRMVRHSESSMDSYEDAVRKGMGEWESVPYQHVGDLTNLNTVNKNDIVSAVNEVEKAIRDSHARMRYDYGDIVGIQPYVSSAGTCTVVDDKFRLEVKSTQDRNYPIIISDPIFGDITLGKLDFPLEWVGEIPRINCYHGILLYIKCNVKHDTDNNTITPVNWETMFVEGGSNVSYMEMENGNTIKSVCIYYGRVDNFPVFFEGHEPQNGYTTSLEIINDDPERFINHVDVTDCNSTIGTLTDLQTTVKTDLVSAINSEVSARQSEDDMLRKFGVNTVYPIDIDKRGSGNNILYINVPGVTSYDDVNGKAVALNTGIYCVQWDEPQTVYININGLGSKALYRPLPTNTSADYDTWQYNTAKYVKGEISRQQTLIVSFSGGTATLLNPAPAPRATKAIEADSTDDVSYVTPKAVSEAIQGMLKNLIAVATLDGEILQMNYPDFDEETGEYEVKFKIPAITVNDSVFGEFSLPAQDGVVFSGQIQNNGYSSPQQEYYYAKYSLNNLFNKGEISLSFNGVTGIKKASGQPISYIEIQDGNLVSAVYIYLGYGEWSGDQPGPAGEQGLYHGACNWNSNTQIPLLHYSVMS